MKTFNALWKLLLAMAIPVIYAQNGIGFDFKALLIFVLFGQFCLFGVAFSLSRISWRYLKKSWHLRKTLALACLAGTAIPAFHYFFFPDQQILARLLIASNLLAGLAFLPLVIVRQPAGCRNLLVDNFRFPVIRFLNPLRIYHINQSGIFD